MWCNGLFHKNSCVSVRKRILQAPSESHGHRVSLENMQEISRLFERVVDGEVVEFPFDVSALSDADEATEGDISVSREIADMDTGFRKLTVVVKKLDYPSHRQFAHPRIRMFVCDPEGSVVGTQLETEDFSQVGAHRSVVAFKLN